MKLAYCFHSLTIHGGVEKIFTVKANYLVRNYGYDITILLYNQQKRPIFFDLDSKIKIVEIEVEPSKLENKNFISRQLSFFKYRKKFIDKLQVALNEIKPDIAISLGGDEFYVLNKLKDKSIKLSEYHVTIGAFDVINENLKGLKKTLAKISFSKFLKNIRLYKKFIVLTEGDRKEWSEFSKNIITIPNPKTFVSERVSNLDNKTAIAVGRFEPEKGFDKLIKMWADVVKRHPNWQLKLKGSGSQADFYKELIQEFNLQNSVSLEEPSEDVSNFYLEGSIYLMASKFEGFSLVMLEAMECGLPILAYNCKYGPSELIKDGYNGFLIQPGDESSYLKKLFMLIEDSEMRKEMGKNGKEKSNNYALDTVMQKWHLLFEGLKND